jgi:ABC-type multidrug transport system ATPase subunit
MKNIIQTTIVTDSVCVNGALKSTKVIILEKGKIVENDSPMSLARQTQFAEFVRDNERYCRPKKHTENDI